MTALDHAGIVSWMTKRSGTPILREGKTPTEYKLAVAARIRERRKYLHLTYKSVAEELTRMVGREIRPDSYRKWETIESIVQVDAILPLCDILQMHVFELLGKAPMEVAAMRPKARGKAAA